MTELKDWKVWKDGKELCAVVGAASYAAVSLALGAEFRRTRVYQGWSSADVVARVSSGVHRRSLENWELGRACPSVVRLVEVSHALRVWAPDVLTLTLQRMGWGTAGVIIDLHAVVDRQEPEFALIRRWVLQRLADEPHTGGVVRLDRAAIEEMARTLGYPCEALVADLASCAPPVAPRTCPGVL